MTQKNFYETETVSQTKRPELWLARGREVGREGWGVWGWQMQLSYTEWVSNKGLLYNTGKDTQYPERSHDGKEYEKEYINICICMYY